MDIIFSGLECEDIAFDSEGYNIPFFEINRIFDFLPKASERLGGFRIAIELLILTGMRVSELDNLKTSSFYGNMVIWKCGKNQKGFRKVKLPSWFLDELDIYIKSHDFFNNKLFSFNNHSLNRFFNVSMRPLLKGNWLKKRPSGKRVCGLEYIYQLKGFRHNFQSFEWHKFYDKFKDASIAVELVSKAMHHHSSKLTLRYYINTNMQEFERYKGLEISDIIKNCNQKRLIDWLN